MLVEPRPWSGPRQGCYILHPAKLIRPTGSSKTHDDARVYDMTRLQRALDSVGRVPWRINQRVMKLMEEIWQKNLEIAGML